MEPVRQDPPDEIDAQWNQLTATGCADWWLMTRAVRQYLPGGWYRQQEPDTANQLTPAAPPAPAVSTPSPAMAAGAAASANGTPGGVMTAPVAPQPPQQQQQQQEAPSQQAAPALAATGARPALAAPQHPTQQHAQQGCGVPIKSCFTCHAADPEAVLDTSSHAPNQAVA